MAGSPLSASGERECASSKFGQKLQIVYGPNKVLKTGHVMLTRKYMAFAGAAVLALLSVWFFAGRGPVAPANTPAGRGPSGPPVVEVATIGTARIVETREAVGTVRAYESIVVTAKVSGIVASINFEEGQMVRAGDVLARLDADERQADLQAAKADITRSKALREEINQKLERARSLRRSGSGTEAQVDDLNAQVKTADSAIAASEARLKAAEARFDDLIIRAPFAGRLGARSVSLGAYVSPGVRITTLDDLSKIRLDFSVPENVSQKLKLGQAVRAKSAAFGERSFTGQVTLIDPRVDAATRTIKLTAEFPNPDEALRPGMFLSVILDVSVSENAIVVPEEALVGEGLRQLVFTVKDNVVERRVVRAGQRQDGKVEILEGVREGEMLVVRGVQKVRPGITVNPRPVDAPPAAGATLSPRS
jgi:membrane fusion protein, multidrug efflux system